MVLFTRGMGRPAEISAPYRYTQTAWGVRAGGEDLVLERHFCKQADGCSKGRRKEEKAHTLVLALGIVF